MSHQPELDHLDAPDDIAHLDFATLATDPIHLSKSLGTGTQVYHIFMSMFAVRCQRHCAFESTDSMIRWQWTAYMLLLHYPSTYKFYKEQCTERKTDVLYDVSHT